MSSGGGSGPGTAVAQLHERTAPISVQKHEVKPPPETS